MKNFLFSCRLTLGTRKIFRKVQDEPRLGLMNQIRNILFSGKWTSVDVRTTECYLFVGDNPDEIFESGSFITVDSVDRKFYILYQCLSRETKN